MADKDTFSYQCHKIAGGSGEGEVLISADDICFYNADPDSGTLAEKNHALDGQSVANKILVFPGGKGSSVAQGMGLHELTKRGTAPKAMIIQNPDTILVAGAVIWKIPLVDRVEEQFYQLVENNAHAKVDADKGLIILIKDTK
jgi:predicted aconitase with swiveling domain